MRALTFRALLHCAAGALLVVLLYGISNRSALAQSPTDTLNLGPAQIAGDGPSYLDLGAGAFDIQAYREAPASAEGRVEFRYGKKLLFIGPAIGLLANTQGGIFGYGGFCADVELGQFVVTPLIAVGGYHRGGSEDLGGTLQGRLSIAVSYELSNQSRLGVQFAHISNAGVHASNPGENEVLLTYTVPLRLR